MILVTGTMRSGTSMWMQVLRAAGLPSIGEAFPGPWEQSIRDANPRGFFESRFRNGVYYATNPHLRTGAFLTPAATRHHAVKVFVPGLVRTDLAYVERVLATVRDWRSYTRSFERLVALETAWRDQQPQGQRAAPSPPLPPPVAWWFDNYDLIRDVKTRGYPVLITTYDRAVQDPAQAVGEVLEWIGGPLDRDAAVAAVAPPAVGRDSLDDEAARLEAWGLSTREVSVFDDFFAAVHSERALSSELLARMNQTWEDLVERHGPPSRERRVRRGPEDAELAEG